MIKSFFCKRAKGDLKIKKLASVQLLRGMAALAVMLFHFRWNINLDYPGVGDALFRWGSIGVELFFIISGFVLVLSAKKMEPGFNAFIRFIKDRALRILPIYYIILIISFFLCGAMSTFHYEEKTLNLISAFLFYPVLPEHAPFYVNDSGFYGVRWTLNYEVMFYLLMSVSLLSKYRWYIFCGFFILLQIVLPLFNGFPPSLSMHGYNFDFVYLRLLTNPLMLMFIPGVLIGLSYPYINRFSLLVKRGLLFFSILVTLFFIFFEHKTGHGVNGSGGCLSFLFMAFVINEDLIEKITHSSLITLGDISFSLYLIHGLMNDGFGKRFAGLGIDDGLPRFFVSCVLSILLAFLSYRFIERNVSTMIKRKKKELKVTC